MDKSEIEIPGFVVEIATEIPEEFADAQKNVARRAVLESERLATQRTMLLAKARHTLMDLGEPLDDLEDYEEAGLLEEVKKIAMEADMVWRFMRRHSYDD